MVAFGTFEQQALTGTVALEYSAKPKTQHKALVVAGRQWMAQKRWLIEREGAPGLDLAVPTPNQTQLR